jgi:hypothetical protein
VSTCSVIEPGPPQSRGRYSTDRRWWWDGGDQQWYQVADGVDVLEVELEDAGGASWWRSLLSTVTGQCGTRSYRFVGRATSANDRWPTYAVASGTFPWHPLQRLEEEPDERAAWSAEVRAQLAALQDDLQAHGWRMTAQGPHWFSQRYERPELDWDTAPDEHGPRRARHAPGY